MFDTNATAAQATGDAIDPAPDAGHETTADLPRIPASAWFASGTRVAWDRAAGRIIDAHETANSGTVQVFRRISNSAAVGADAVWASFLPGWPDGSYGWAQVDRHLANADIGPRLFAEYVGHGDSDKPADWPFNTDERADMVEAHWRDLGIRRTFLITFDYSSIVALELLSRQLEREARGQTVETEIIGVVLANGGLFADAHSHPWYTTPVLKSPFGGIFTALANRSRRVFAELMAPLWGKDYTVSQAELDDLRDAIGRRNGSVILSKSADFVDHHKRNATRLDLGRLYMALREKVAFHVVGSAEDPFEGRQPVAAKERLGKLGLDVRILPGGHLTTSEHPDLLAKIIAEVVPAAVD